MSVRAARSFLFVPGSRADRFAKADAAGADVVVIDLEDAVADDDKSAARRAAGEWLVSHAAVIRCNPAGSPHQDADLAMLSDAALLTGVVLPKAECAAQVVTVARQTGVPVLPLVETALGVHHVHEIAEAPGVERLVLGTIDLAADLACQDSWDAMLLARSTLVLASRVAGLAAPVDGVHADLGDLEGLLEGTRRSRDLGFGGRLCLHPRQVPVVHAALAPTPDEIAWARRVLADEGAVGAVGTVDGSMVDAPVRARARAVLAHVTESEET